MHTLVLPIVICTVLGFQKAPGIEQVLKPRLTLLEQVDSERNDLDTWVVDEFMFIPPRMITVDVPGKNGRRLLWYMVYRVTNRGNKPRLLVPAFTLVDDKGKAYPDVIMPKAQRAIQTRENPLRPLENSVTMVGLLEPSIEEGIDKPKYGVAIWDGIDPSLNSFSILIVGFSNGYRKSEGPTTGQTAVQRKTLQLKFARPGDKFFQNEREIRYTGHEWIYR